MDSAFIRHIARDAGLSEMPVAAVISLFEKGATAPFIAAYRKEVTGGVSAEKIRAIQERLTYYREVQERRASLLKLLTDQKKLTEELRQRIENCFTKVELDDLHQLFKPRRRTRAAEAIEKGLEPLAEYLWNQEPDAWSLEEHADVFIDPEKKVPDREHALQGASDIVAEWISENLGLRRTLREVLWKDGALVSTVVPAKTDQKTKYNMYYDRREPVATIPSHRVLAIRRGTKEGVLTSAIEGDTAKAIEQVISAVVRDRESAFAPILEIAARDSYNRILKPLVETEVRAQLKERADREAIRVFQENLTNLLLSPPAGPMIVLGLDPGKGEECKLAIVDPAGGFVEESSISPLPPKSDLDGARATLRDLISKHTVQAIAIGSGAAAREIESILRQILEEEKIENVLLAAVNDAGLAVYSSSRAAREEFPELSIPTRCAISLARRLQDPLSELVKIDPKLIGVGQYQHDVDQKELHRALHQTVQFCVNGVGVDLNTGAHSLLRYVAGLNDKVARRIVGHRTASGPFPSRAMLQSVPGIDELTYQQAAGFLRVRNGEHPMDATAVHPESYPIAEKMAAALGIPLTELVGNHDRVSTLKLEDFVDEHAGMPTLSDIREELLRPGRDPRKTFAVPKFRSDVRQIGDLKEGMTLEGTVTNVTNFGAFVDIGVHQDGLVHLSQMSNRFIRDPREAVKVGDVVQVKVISVEVETKRIGLSMKALLPAIPRRRKRPRPVGRPGRQPVPAGAEAAASPVSSIPDGAEAAVVEAAARPPRNPGRNRIRPHHSRPRPEKTREFTPHEKEAKAEEPKGPEPTLQEKIAILQSKFRGIS
jgi:uncharacterized protein